jgi:hypothetical protein
MIAISSSYARAGGECHKRPCPCQYSDIIQARLVDMAGAVDRADRASAGAPFRCAESGVPIRRRQLANAEELRCLVHSHGR